jgi:hypothetical protein
MSLHQTCTIIGKDEVTTNRQRFLPYRQVQLSSAVFSISLNRNNAVQMYNAESN